MKKMPGPRSNQRDFLLESMLMAQYLFKCLCLIVPLLITDLLSCIFTIEEWECDPHSYRSILYVVKSLYYRFKVGWLQEH